MNSDANKPETKLADVAQRPRRKGVQAHPLGDELLLYTPEMARAFSFNQTAQAVWDLCDGQRTLAEISQHLATRYDATPDKLLADVQETVRQLQELGLLEPEAS
jgi:hypothetical protein